MSCTNVLLGIYGLDKELTLLFRILTAWLFITHTVFDTDIRDKINKIADGNIKRQPKMQVQRININAFTVLVVVGGGREDRRSPMWQSTTHI